MTNPNSIAKVPLRQVQDVRSLLQNDQAREQLASVAAQHLNPQRLMRVTANAIRTTPKLQECEPLSFLGALMQCASLGLEPNTILGHAYLIPFKNNRKNVMEVQLIIGYKGLIDLARRSGHITSISANIHYSDDELWEYEEGTEARLRHRPSGQEGEKQHAYAIAQFKDGGHAYVVLPWAQVMKTRDGSQGWQTAVKYGSTNRSPWFTHEDAMAKKTAIRALSKYLPLSVEFIDAVQSDSDSDSKAKMDYASYALRPEEGVTLEHEEQEAIEEEEKPKAKAKPKAKPKPKAKEEPKDEGEETGGYDEQTGEVLDEGSKKEEPEKQDEEEKPSKKRDSKVEGTVNAELKRAVEQIEADLLDGMPSDQVRQWQAETLDRMKAEAPDLYEEVVALLDGAEADAE